MIRKFLSISIAAVMLLTFASCMEKDIQNPVSSGNETTAASSTDQITSDSSASENTTAAETSSANSNSTAAKTSSAGATTKRPSATTTTTKKTGGTSVYKNIEYKNDNITSAMYAHSILNEGNTARLKSVIKKAMSGERITIGFIGGSITQGSAASSPSKNYSNLVTKWWKDTFPNTVVTYINAGIGATGSIIGVSRVEDDLLFYNPDFVVVEFAVNDGVDNDPLAKEAYEGLIRRILSAPSKPAVMLLFMSRQDGSNCQEPQGEIGMHYSLPMISYRDAIWHEISAGALKWSDVSADSVHPNDKGHNIAAGLIINQLVKVYNKVNVAEQDKTLPNPITKNRFINAKLYTNLNLTPSSMTGWQKFIDTSFAFPNGWKSVEKNKPLSFNMKMSVAVVLYKKTTNNKGGKASVSVDGTQRAVLDAHFPGGWGDYAALQTVLDENSSKSHTISVTHLNEASAGSNGSEFNILGFIIA